MSYRTSDPPNKYSEDTQGYFAWALGLFVLVAVAFTLVLGIIQSNGGPSASDHPTALPSGVSEIDANTYLISNRTVPAASICWDTDSNGASIYGDHYLPPQNGFMGVTFVQCAVDQHWNVHTPVAPNLPTMVERMWLNPAYEIGAGVILGLALIPGLFMAAGDRRRYRREAARYRASLEDIRREIRVAFANDEIDQVTMMKTLDKLYASGVKPETDAKLPKEIKALDSYGKGNA